MTNKKRTLNLSKRTANCTNLNFSPEKAGKELVERVDMSMSFLVEDLDIDELVNTKGNPLQVLWHKDGGPQLRELSKLELGLKVEGAAEFGINEENMIEFKAATLKKVSVMPLFDRKLEVKCQVRVDPTGHLEALGEMRINESCMFGFSGIGVATGDKKDDQGKLDV